MKRLLLFASVAAFLGLATLLPAPCFAIPQGASATVSMGDWANASTLTTKNYLKWRLQDATGDGTLSGPGGSYSDGFFQTNSVTGQSGRAKTISFSGTSYAELRNDTDSSVTLTGVSLSITASGTTNWTTASANSDIDLDETLSAGMCDGIPDPTNPTQGNSYSDPETVIFTNQTLAPTGIVSKSGSFGLYAYGG